LPLDANENAVLDEVLHRLLFSHFKKDHTADNRTLVVCSFPKIPKLFAAQFLVKCSFRVAELSGQVFIALVLSVAFLSNRAMIPESSDMKRESTSPFTIPPTLSLISE
jgi:hypothetical protein